MADVSIKNIEACERNAQLAAEAAAEYQTKLTNWENAWEQWKKDVQAWNTEHNRQKQLLEASTYAQDGYIWSGDEYVQCNTTKHFYPPSGVDIFNNCGYYTGTADKLRNCRACQHYYRGDPVKSNKYKVLQNGNLVQACACDSAQRCTHSCSLDSPLKKHPTKKWYQNQYNNWILNNPPPGAEPKPPPAFNYNLTQQCQICSQTVVLQDINASTGSNVDVGGINNVMKCTQQLRHQINQPPTVEQTNAISETLANTQVAQQNSIPPQSEQVAQNIIQPTITIGGLSFNQTQIIIFFVVILISFILTAMVLIMGRTVAKPYRKSPQSIQI